MKTSRFTEEARLMAKIAHLYYERGLGQSEIATQLDMSQAGISRLLKRSLDEGIVQISINYPQGFFAQLEDELQQKYGLKEVIVVETPVDAHDDEIQRALGTAAAFYLHNTLKQNDLIGLSSWSSTLLAMVDAMPPISRALNATVVQILGGVGSPGAKVHATRLTERLSALINARSVFLSAPGVVGSEETRRILMEDVFVAESLALFDQVTLALVGIGDIEPSKLLASSGNRFSAEELDMLRENGAAGDICLRFYDNEGIPIKSELDQRVIGMTLEQLREVKRSVGIAGGERKITAIRGALKGGWINVLITDRAVAEALAQ